MATRSSILAWKIPGTEEPGGLLKSLKRLSVQTQHTHTHTHHTGYLIVLLLYIKNKLNGSFLSHI